MKMPCTEEGCQGSVDSEQIVPLQTGCRAASPAYPCDTCGRLHWGDGSPVFNGRQQKAFWRGDYVELVGPEVTPDVAEMLLEDPEVHSEAGIRVS